MLVNFFYYTGLVACAIYGTKNAINAKRNGLYEIQISALINSFGGGFVRDVLLLGCFPTLFKRETSPEIILVIVASVCFLLLKKQTIKHLKFLFLFFDAAGLTKFICIGVTKAIDYGQNSVIVFMCGIITALGGGILSSIYCGATIKSIIIYNVIYRLWVCVGTITYMIMITNNTPTSVAQNILLIIMIQNVFLGNIQLKTFKLQELYQYNTICKSMLLEKYMLFLIVIPNAIMVFDKRKSIKRIINTHTNNKKNRVILFCHIRQISKNI